MITEFTVACYQLVGSTQFCSKGVSVEENKLLESASTLYILRIQMISLQAVMYVSNQ